MSDIGRTRVSLRIVGVDLIPEEISNLLGCFPTMSAEAGDADPRSKYEARTVKVGFWHLGLDEEDSSVLDKKLEELLNSLTNDLEVWKQITSRFRVDIFCGLFLDSFNEGFELTPSLLKRLAERNLKIGFDIYSYSDERQNEPPNIKGNR